MLVICGRSAHAATIVIAPASIADVPIGMKMMISRRQFGIGIGAVLMAGDQLRRPLNAPPAYPPAYGTQPGVSNEVVFARRVIIFGPNDGLFVYNGSPAANNLIESITDSLLQDMAGNWLLPGSTSYGPDTFSGSGYIALQTFNGSMTWYRAATMQGVTTPWTAFATAQWNPGGMLIQVTSGGGPVKIQALGANTVQLASAGATGAAVMSKADITGNATGNVTTPTDITVAYTAGSAKVGTVYEIGVWFNGTWGGQTLTFYADVNGGTFTQVGLPVGAVFGTGVASGDSVAGHARMVFQVVSATAMRIHLEGALFDSTQNGGRISTSTQVNLGGTVATGIGFAAGDTLAVAVAFGGSTAGQTIVPEGSEMTVKLA